MPPALYKDVGSKGVMRQRGVRVIAASDALTDWVHHGCIHPWTIDWTVAKTAVIGAKMMKAGSA